MELIKKVFLTEIKEADDSDMSITAKISTSAVDRQQESLDHNGVDLAHYRKNPVVLWAHDYSTPPIGKAVWVKKTDEGVISKVKFYSSDKILGEFAKEIYQMYKQGFLNAFSVGFIPREVKNAEDKDWDNPKKPRRTYTKWDMIEYSAVPVPANPEALQMAFQKGDIKSPMWKSLLTKSEPEALQEFNNEEVKTEVKEVEAEVVVNNDTNGDEISKLMDEAVVLNEKIVSLEKENDELRYKLFLNKQSSSEITANDVVKTFEDVMTRVIRKAQGKLD